MATFKYLLETSTCIELLRGNLRVRQQCIEKNQLCCISVITAIELLYGAYNSPDNYREQEIAKAKMLTDYFTVVGIDEIPEAFSREKIRLENNGLVIEDFDLMIGITGREADMIVVTHNLKHFNRIDGLKVEDWAV
ncbi:MAG: PIN domain-containing protein [Salinivirgaceae bacterium]|nr:PIN domain-containing protein [Salinivirgaceae bacterium]